MSFEEERREKFDDMDQERRRIHFPKTHSCVDKVNEMIIIEINKRKANMV